MASAKTDPRTLAVYEKEMLALRADEAFAKRLAAISTAAKITNAAEAKQTLARENARWGKIIAAAGLGGK